MSSTVSLIRLPHELCKEFDKHVGRARIFLCIQKKLPTWVFVGDEKVGMPKIDEYTCLLSQRISHSFAWDSLVQWIDF
jgi:hypothetical protein